MNSNNKKIVTVINLIRSDRTITTLLLSVLLIIIMGSLRPKTTSGMYEKRYWATKITWKNYADVVITGDSRALGAISPEIMQEILQNISIVNYGFASNLYVPKYLDSVEDVLKKESDRKTIILGITPHSFIKYPEMTGPFFELRNLSQKDIFMYMHFANIFSFFEYMSFRDALLGLFPELASGQTHKEYFSDGWLAFSKNPPGKKRELKKYQQMYQGCEISQEMIENLTSYVSRWTESKIQVYGFLVPTCKEMFELEEELSGFKLAEFKAVFQEAGGIWIDIDPASYDSFDGSHLQRESAVQLSKDLAQKIYEIEQHN